MALPRVGLECEVDDSPPFRLYSKPESGEKTVEVRLLLPTAPGRQPTKWWALYPGAYASASLAVACKDQPTRRFAREVARTTVHVGYRAALEAVGCERCAPGAASVEEAIELVYARFYPLHLQGYDVLAIELAR